MTTVNSHRALKPLPGVSFVVDQADLDGTVSYTYGGNSYVYRGGTSNPGYVQTNPSKTYPDGSNDNRYLAYRISTNKLIHFTARLTIPDAPVIQYEWDFGDGVLGYGPNVTHTYITASPETSVSITATLVDGRKVYSNQVMNISPGTIAMLTRQRAN